MNDTMEAIRDLLRSEQPVKWLFTGDSLTHGAVYTFGARDYTELFSERVRSEMLRLRDFVIKTGVGGRTTQHILDDFDWTVAQFTPDVVFLMIGMNDCNQPLQAGTGGFEDRLIRLSQRILALPNCRLALQTSNAILTERAAERGLNAADHMEVVRSVARALDVPLIDHTKYWEEKIAEDPARLITWLGDAIHPNPYGHLVFAELLFQELGIVEPVDHTHRFFHP